MNQFKKLILSMFILLSTGLYANTVNMAPIISYLLSNTTSVSASNFTMQLDVNESTAIGDWKVLASVNGMEVTATILTQGTYGIFEITSDSLSYEKTMETNATDIGILAITNGVDTLEITVTIESLYWKQLFAGDYHTAAIKSDGTLWSWGYNGSGQLGDDTNISKSIPTQEFTEATDWISVSAGGFHTAAIKSDGTLWAWGSGANGRLGDDTNISKSIPTQEFTEATNWSSVSAGTYHTTAIKSDGTLWSWGSNNYGRLGDGTTEESWVPSQEFTEASDWSSVSAGRYHTAAIKSNSSIWAWGLNGNGQLGDDTNISKSIPIQEFTEATDWISVSAGGWHTAAIKSDGTLWAWGSGANGRLGDGTTDDKWVPTQEFTEATDWSSVSAGKYHTAAIKSDGTLWAWGSNISGRLGDGTTEESWVPVQEITESTDWSSVSAGGYHTTTIKLDGTLWAWGDNTYSQLGDGTTEDSLVPTQVQPRDSLVLTASDFTVQLDVNESTVMGDWKVLASVNDTEATATVLTQGTYGVFEITGDSLSYLKNTETNAADIGILQITNGRDTVEITVTVNTLFWEQITTGYYHSAGIKSDGTIWSWGTNFDRALGNHTSDSSWVPVQEFTQSTDWTFLDAGYNNTFAIKYDNTLWAWGYNQYGQLGDGTIEVRPDPIQIGTDDYIFVSAGFYHTAAIKSDGTLWAWGRNNYGQLGDDTNISKLIPTQEFSQSSDWASVSVGNFHTAAIKSDGTLWVWGYNGNGRLGDSTTVDKWVPTQIGTDEYIFISAGGAHTVAIKSDNTLWAWGLNEDGQLGDNTTVEKHVPTQEFTQASDWVSVSTGFYHTAALKSDGTLWSWGYNGVGQIGDGTEGEERLIPTREYTNADNWSVISAGYYYTMSIRSDGTLWGWGANNFRQLGEGISIDRNTTFPTLSFPRQP